MKLIEGDAEEASERRSRMEQHGRSKGLFLLFYKSGGLIRLRGAHPENHPGGM